MEDGVAFARLDLGVAPDVRFQRLRTELGITAFGLNLIVLQPGQRGRVHAHRAQEEVFLVLRGTLTLVLEDGEHELGEHELVRVAPSVRRQLVNRGPQPLALVAIGGAGEHEGRDGEAWEDWTPGPSAPPADVPLPADLPAAERRG